MRRIATGLGVALVGLGILILLFVAYQLWGTKLSEASSQNALRHQIAGKLGAGRTPAQSPGTTVAPSQSPSTTVLPRGPAALTPAPPEGNAVGIMKIARIGVDQAIVEGTGTDDLRRGPGHYLGTPLPGQAGNAAIAGHRTTYGAPFGNLDKLAQGDPIVVSTPQGDFQYDVTRSLVVSPDDVTVIAPTTTNQLTLTTCTPRYSAAQRLIVQASLVGTPVASAPAVIGPSVPRDNLAGVGGKGAWAQALGWGLAAAVVVVAVLLAHRRRRRWPAYLVGIPVFLVLLFEFFGAISKIVPASF